MTAAATLAVPGVLTAALADVLATAPDAWPDPTDEQAAALEAAEAACESARPAEAVAAAHRLERLIADWSAARGRPAAAHGRLAHAIHRRR